MSINSIFLEIVCLSICQVFLMVLNDNQDSINGFHRKELPVIMKYRCDYLKFIRYMTKLCNSSQISHNINFPSNMSPTTTLP